MSTFRLAIAVAVLGYVLYAYHDDIAGIGASTSPDLPAQTSSYDFHPVTITGCAMTNGGCPAQQGQGAIPGSQ
jgi:hypothetical protein